MHKTRDKMLAILGACQKLNAAGIFASADKLSNFAAVNTNSGSAYISWLTNAELLKRDVTMGYKLTELGADVADKKVSMLYRKKQITLFPLVVAVAVQTTSATPVQVNFPNVAVDVKEESCIRPLTDFERMTGRVRRRG